MDKKTKTIEGLNFFHLSDQALGAVMMALQNSLLNQTDIVPTLKSMKFVNHPDEGLVVTNPPIIRTNDNQLTNTDGSTIVTSQQ
tara:strand:+ start:1344 stop:1595 length:252 start_codon:yes stop_codon:yes gene_type:complete